MSFKKFKKLFLSLDDLKDPESTLRILNSIQNNISTSLQSITSNIQNDTTVLTDVELKSGAVNVINHTLDRNINGWKLVRLRTPAIVSDVQDSNKSQNLTLLLVTTADTVVDIEVF